ncbi:MAG: phosphotransferase [Candidatus Eiseniibacteriota bacterium]|nr:MAG: phosphotransferase [Candidatus Eisenbacteria bacterium]
MTDIHCHVLPFVDYDGPQDTEESMRMLECAFREGIGCVIATPHVTSGDSRGRLDEFRETFANLRQSALEQNLPIDLRLGAEVYVSPDLCDFVKEAPVSLDGAGRYVLVELPMYEFPPFVQSQLFSLISENIVPILAHPERNSNVIRNPEVLFSLSKAGVLFQLNAGSLVGSFGREVKKTAETLLTSGLCQFVASDAHGDRARGFRMKEARSTVRRLVGESLAEAIFEDNPRRTVVEGSCSWTEGDA